MKKLTILTLLLTVSFFLNAQNENDSTEVNIKKEVRELGSFNKIKTSKGINVTLIEGDKESIEVNIKNGEPSDIASDISGKTLTLKMRTKIYKNMAVQVYVTYKKLIELDAGSGSTIDCDGAVICDHINLDVGMDAEMDLEIYAKSIEANVSAGRIDISGETDYQEVKATTGAKYNARELKTKETFIKANTGSIAKIYVTEKLTASAGTGGQINYNGDPEKVDKSESVGGKVESVK